MLRAVTFLTIGQTPRTDLVPELVSWLPGKVAVDELGALDGRNRDQVAALAPSSGQPRLVTRMADGTQAIVRKDWIRDRLQEMLDGMEPRSDRVLVLLCTGAFPGLVAPGLFLDAQHLVDAGVDALCANLRRIGVVLPVPEQGRDFHYRPGPRQDVVTAFASPYAGNAFGAAGAALASCDAVVMHCIGFTEAHRRQVAAAAGRPVLLARRMVAAAVAQLL